MTKEIVPLTEDELAEKEAQQASDEMSEEMTEAFIDNIQALVPKEWQPRINEMLPKILGMVKHALKGAIKNLSKELGENDKMFLVKNVKHKFGDKVYWRPRFYVIEYSTLEKFKLIDGTAPKIDYPLADLCDKIEAYKTIQSLMIDLKNGSLLSIAPPTDASELPAGEEQKNIASAEEHKQLPAPNQ